MMVGLLVFTVRDVVPSLVGELRSCMLRCSQKKLIDNCVLIALLMYSESYIFLVYIEVECLCILLCCLGLNWNIFITILIWTLQIN